MIMEMTYPQRYAVRVIMGMPQQFPDGYDDYFCPFQIVGISNVAFSAARPLRLGRDFVCWRRQTGRRDYR